MIIYGWNNFLIQKFSAFELGLTQNFADDYQIEARQKYFHIFWIPFFSLGKMWCIRHNDELYEVPADMMATIKNQNIQAKTPIYTYIGLIVIAFFFVASSIQSTANDISYKNELIQKEKARTETLSAKIDGLEENTYIVMGFSGKLATRSLCKVENIKGNELNLLKLDGAGAIERKPLEEIEIEFNNRVDEVKDLKITKQDLKKAIAKDYNIHYGYYNDGFEVFNDGQKYYIYDIVKIEGALSVIR